ncbi:endolytic transglycosylase MltG [Bacillus horti]|uniref:Endolytic murein transglycosylase n=1 Tax=Caldalkalibacillus horti TaxID=77523 RepID=A0ABT9VTA3_9BACI|nr:endolytic transglycosylase MltG [Bacillus horti]MDQ0164215.1 UPF0755 protein [Bacillus horti]
MSENNGRHNQEDGKQSTHSELSRSNKQKADENHPPVDEEEEYEQEYSSFSGFKIVLITLLTIILVVGLAGGIGAYYVYANLQPVDDESEEIIEIEVPMGSSGTRIASILKENDLIRHENIFYYYVRYKGHSGFQAGTYYLTQSLSPEEIIELLKEGRVHQETVRFTIAEGLTIDQISVHLENEGLANADRFKELSNQPELFEEEFAFLSYLPEEREDIKYLLEGFLFPETYEIFQGADEEVIIRVMLSQFDKEFNRIVQTLNTEDEGWEQKLEERGLTIFDMITLASIVEREAVVNDERKTIAGVFHNRLEDEWLLQSCATVQFVLGKQRDRILYEDLAVEHPYNSYINEGLPPGPIASPGRESILATFNPENHEYYFFVTKKDGSGSHHFSRTFEEHQQNDAQSRGNF